ncbi:type VI secretion system tube protein Hcp [uncultured Rhodospira sp.]|uniref:Hcp family type VI secretion system effector n=1 Tax=uncultured Rhodospira sp. TaxID=1936189 RepID=UPI00261CB5DD|nr:type VI secretion system tube protein Hcp [uncultured Rhodospira sp.]
MAIFAKYGTVKGNATHGTHKDWMDILTFDWGLERAISTPSQSAAKRMASETVVFDVTLTKALDEASASLLMEAFTKKSSAHLEVHQVATHLDNVNVAEYIFRNAMVTRYTTNSSGDRPIETISFNFTKLEFCFTIMDEDGKTKPVTGEYDLALARQMGNL